MKIEHEVSATPPSCRELDKVLQKLDEEGILWAVWKGFEGIEDSFAGEGDLDLLFNEADLARVIDLGGDLGWFEAERPGMSFPSVIHLFHHGGNGTPFHLHCYFGLTTGHSWIKEYRIPGSREILANRIRDVSLRVWKIAPADARAIFLFRYFVKCSSWGGRWLYFRELDTYRLEWSALADDSSGIPARKGIIGAGLEPYYAASGELQLPPWLHARHVRKRAKPHRRMSFLRLKKSEFLMFFSMARRILFRVPRRLSGGGIVFAFVGPDGAGKSTLASSMVEVLRHTLRVRHFHMGKPASLKWFRALRLGLKKSIRSANLASESKSPLIEPSYTQSLRFAVSSLLTAGARFLEAHKARFFANRGFVVVADRWPRTILGAPDGPRISPPRTPNWPTILAVSALIERKLYDATPAADIVIFVVVDVQLALQRNALRQEADRDSPVDITRRFSGSYAGGFGSAARIDMENSGTLEAGISALLSLAQREIARAQARVPG